jgi:hypothetical protein
MKELLLVFHQLFMKLWKTSMSNNLDVTLIGLIYFREHSDLEAKFV